MRWDISPDRDTFHHTFSWRKHPTRARYFSSLTNSLTCFMSLFTYLFCFYLNIELLINIHTDNFCKMNYTFSCNNYKNTQSKLNEQSACQRLFTWRKVIRPKWDLACVEVISHLGGIYPFSYKPSQKI